MAKIKINKPVINAVEFNYNELVKLSSKLKATKGKGARVAIMDCGCFEHVSIKNAITSAFDVFTKTNNQTDISDVGHGTFLAGLIGGRNAPGSKIVGIAPQCELMIVKVSEDGTYSASNVIEGLKWMNELSSEKLPHILNMSFDCFPKKTLRKEYDDLLDSLIQKGVYIVAAGQNEENIYTTDNLKLFYPAWHTNVIGVGSISPIHKLNLLPHPNILFCTETKEMFSLKNGTDGYQKLSGASISAATVSGALALCISFNLAKKSDTNALELLSNEVQCISDASLNGELNIFKK